LSPVEFEDTRFSVLIVDPVEIVDAPERVLEFVDRVHDSGRELCHDTNV